MAAKVEEKLYCSLYRCRIAMPGDGKAIAVK
jgi:hypothetical protein